jgi:exodeoxyribonuclease VII large subunit
MEQLPFFQPAVLSVSELNHALHQLLESETSLQNLWVQGEISNASRPASGHLYFTLKDSSASLPCVMWRNAAMRMRLPLRDGMAVEVHGKVDFYEVGGRLQLNVDLVRPAGEGRLFQEFLRLKAMLEAEGLFDPSRKRPLPQFPHRIGIVTSPSGAALQDMLNVLRRRYPLAEVALSPTPVQGEEAPSGIVTALERLNRLFNPDVILVARGGGSLEDLWAFNDERVVRAIAASAAPVVTGVGHETDFTLADFAADLRAPTPTAAAELTTPNRLDLLEAASEQAASLVKAYQGILSGLRWQTESQHNRIQRYSPLNRIHRDLQRLDEVAHRLNQAVQHNQQIYRLHLEGLHTRLAGLSPTAVLKRGFALVTRQADGQLVTSTRRVVNGDALRVRVSDGTFDARVSDQ